VIALERRTEDRMSSSPLLFFHIGAGSLGLLAGAAAMCFRKGSPRHRTAGNVFVVSMLGLAASGAYLGFSKHQTLNGLMGLLTMYLVVTAWSTARRRDGETNAFDWAALLVVLSVGTTLVTLGFEAARSPSGALEGFTAPAYFIFGSLALAFALGDVRMLVRGGVSGVRRTARHLTRMSVALFIAAGSLFLGQPQVFPEAVRKSNVLFVPSILPLALLVFWLFRVRSPKAYDTRRSTDFT
jgi:hypothetical protein